MSLEINGYKVAPVLQPSGTINITENGTVDVTNYSTADVDVHDNTTLNALLNGTLTELYNDEVTYLRHYAFSNASGLKKVEFPAVTGFGTGVFQRSGIATGFFLTANLNANDVFYYCTSLEVLDFGNVTRIGGIDVFTNCSKFKHLILRKTSVAALNSIGCFTGTPFRNGTGGTVYVPYDYVSNYQTATNWKSLESTTFSAIQENLVTLLSFGVDITDYYTIVTELPTTDIDNTIVYFKPTATAGTYEQWFHGSGSWEQLADITLSGGDN